MNKIHNFHCEPVKLAMYCRRVKYITFFVDDIGFHLWFTTFSDLNICGLVLDSLYADTTGDKFMWLIAYMMKYRDVLDKCRVEMNKVSSSVKLNLNPFSITFLQDNYMEGSGSATIK